MPPAAGGGLPPGPPEREGEGMEVNLKFFLKDTIRQMVDFSGTAQSLGLEPPPVQKPWPAGAAVMALPGPEAWGDIGQMPVRAAMAGRKSRRAFRDAPLGLEELAFLLWATQGVRQMVSPAVVYRTVPSAGCRHALETYLAIFRVTGLDPGLYRYLPLDQALVEVGRRDDLEAAVVRAALGQRFVGKGAATFLWTTLPERMEWRYGEAAYKVIALDAGHVCQNLYLACEAVGAGTCAVAAYDQDAADELLGVDGEEEFTIYMAPVGKA
jgi:SagB-type dehydrogenase family enzyme